MAGKVDEFAGVKMARSPVYGTRGMVVSGHSLASLAGPFYIDDTRGRADGRARARQHQQRSSHSLGPFRGSGIRPVRFYVVNVAAWSEYFILLLNSAATPCSRQELYQD